MSPGLDLYYTDLAQHLKTAGVDLDDLDRGLSDMCKILVVCLRGYVAVFHARDARASRQRSIVQRAGTQNGSGINVDSTGQYLVVMTAQQRLS